LNVFETAELQHGSAVFTGTKVLDGEVEPVVENDDNALLGIESSNSLSDDTEVVALLEHGRLPRDIAVERPQRLAAPEQVDCPVGRDPLQPGCEGTRLVEAVERAERALNGILRRVVGERAVGGDGVRGPPGVLPVAIEERAGRLGRALTRKGDQLGVGTPPHAFLLRTSVLSRIPPQEAARMRCGASNAPCRQASAKTATTSGSNCVPAHRSNSATAWPCVSARR
jgi:hypothetical protein